MGKTIGIIAIKGGVGKTTIASSLASDLVNHHGKKVLLVDANYSAPNLGIHMDILNPEKTIHDVLAGTIRIESAIQNKFGVDVIPGSYSHDKDLNLLKLKDKLKNIKEKYDFVILDTSPSLNEEILSSILASDSLFVVSTPDYPTISCSLKAAKLAKQRGKPIHGIILNKIRDPKFELNLKEIEEGLGIPVVAKIHDDISNVGALFMRIPTSVYHRNSDFAKEIHNFSSALTNKSEKRGFIRKMFFPNFKREEVNRQVLRENFYSNVFNVLDE